MLLTVALGTNVAPLLMVKVPLLVREPESVSCWLLLSLKVPPLIVKSINDNDVGVGKVSTPAPFFTKLRLVPTIGPAKLVLELRFMVRVLPVARVKVGEPEIVLPFKEILLGVLFELVVVRLALRLSVPPWRVMGPLMVVADEMVMPEVLPDLPRVSAFMPETVTFGTGYVNAVTKEVLVGSIVS